jgi:serine/threonine protein kinase
MRLPLVVTALLCVGVRREVAVPSPQGAAPSPPLAPIPEGDGGLSRAWTDLFPPSPDDWEEWADDLNSLPTPELLQQPLTELDLRTDSLEPPTPPTPEHLLSPLTAAALMHETSSCDTLASTSGLMRKRSASSSNCHVKSVGGYQLEGRIGKGMQGNVYRARRSDGARVALKEFFAHDACKHEGTILELAHQQRDPSSWHPNIVGYHGTFTEDGRCFLVLEHLQGVSLFKVMVQSRRPLRMTLTSAVLRAMDGGVDAVLAGVAAGLEHLNRRGIFWVDFKPDNIVVTSDGRVKLLDFGLAATKADVLGKLQTNGYMKAPRLPMQSMPNEFAPWECLQRGGCCVNLGFDDVGSPGKFDTLEFLQDDKRCPPIEHRIEGGEKEVWNSWDVWSLATLELFMRTGVKPTLPCGAFYHGVPDNKCDDVNYPNTTVMEILGDLEMALYHAEELTVCRPIEDVQNSLVAWKIPDALARSIASALRCHAKHRPSLSSLKRRYALAAAEPHRLRLALEYLDEGVTRRVTDAIAEELKVDLQGDEDKDTLTAKIRTLRRFVKMVLDIPGQTKYGYHLIQDPSTHAVKEYQEAEYQFKLAENEYHEALAAQE